MKIKILTTILIALSLLFTTTIHAQPLQPLTIVLDWFLNPDHAPLFVAQEKGYFQQEGLAVKFITPADPNDPPKLVAAHKADLAISYQPNLIMQVTQGLPLVRIATLIDTPLNCLAVNPDSNIHSIADLKGKTIGYCGATDYVSLTLMLAPHGLSLKDVHLVNVNYDLVQALLMHRVDAIIGICRNFEPIEMQLANHPARIFYVEENGMLPYDELIIVANRDKLTDPKLSRFLIALNLGTQYLVNHPDECWQAFAKAHPELNNELNRRAWYATLPRFSLEPAALDVTRYQRFAAALQKNNLISKIPPLNQYAIQLNY